MADAALKRRNIGGLIAFIALALGGGTAIGVATGPDAWFAALAKPSFNPPGWVFGPAWTTLYAMMGIADFLVSREGGARATNARRIYRVQLVLNGLWSVLFFGMRSPLAALVEIAFLWVAIVMTIAAFWRVSRLAAALLVPYLLWTTFAAMLNGAIWAKNR